MINYRPLIEKDIEMLAENVCSTGLHPYDFSFSLYVNPNGTLDLSFSQINSPLRGQSHMVNLLSAGYTGSCVVEIVRDGYGLENEDGLIRVGYLDKKIETYGFEVTVYNSTFYAQLPHPFISPNHDAAWEVTDLKPKPAKRPYGINKYYFPHVIKSLLNTEGKEAEFSLNN